MRKLLTGIAAGAALVLLMSSGQACDLREMQSMASTAPPPEPVVAMNTYDGAAPPAVAEQVARPECPSGAQDCLSANK